MTGAEVMALVESLEALTMSASEDPSERLSRRQDLLDRLQSADAHLLDEGTRHQVATRLRAVTERDQRVIAEAKSTLHSLRESRGERAVARAAVRGYRSVRQQTSPDFERDA